MKKIFVKDDRLYVTQSAENVDISVGNAEEYDATSLSKKEFEEIRKDPQKARSKLKKLKKLDKQDRMD